MTDRKSTPELDDTMALPDTLAGRAPRSESGALSLLEGHDAASLRFTAEKIGGRYEIISLLGSGGMGTVYRAKDLTLDELVALKVLREELADDEMMLARFRQEVKLARKVTHTNVARTFDIGEHGSQKFITMELVEGRSLADAIEDGATLPIERVVEIASAMCAGLGAAHAAGIVHRDLKPENVLLSHDGRVVITDFGIARGADPSAVVKTHGGVLGTPAYMAPEQVEGAKDLDGRADIYALGAILFELLTGTRAWLGDSVFVVAAKRLVEPPPDPRTRKHDVPDAAARITMRCMARARDERFQTASEVASALAAISLKASIPPPSMKRPVPATAATQKTVAVLPFRNAGKPDDAYLADGLTDDLIDLLSVTEGLRVCARGIVVARATPGQDPRELGQSLGVQVVVEGSVRRTDGRLRVTARVLSVGDGFQLWAKRLDYAESAFYEVSDAMAKAVAEALTLQAGGAPREAPTDPIALDLYLRARHEYQKFWRESIVASVGLYEQALARAPNDPQILAGYAVALTRLCGFDDATDEHHEASRKATERAHAVAPNLAATKVARAYQKMVHAEAVPAAHELREVLAASPDFVDALDLSGRLLGESGPIDEAILRLTRTLELDPAMAAARFEIARLDALRGDRAASEAFFGDEPDHPGLSNVYWLNRCRVALWQHDTERAKLWRPIIRARPKVFLGVDIMLGALLGEPPPPEFVQLVRHSATATSPLLRRRGFFAILAAEFGMHFGDPSISLEALEHADEALVFDLTWMDLCPTLAPIRHEPRFLAVRARMAERAAAVQKAFGF